MHKGLNADLLHLISMVEGEGAGGGTGGTGGEGGDKPPAEGEPAGGEDDDEPDPEGADKLGDPGKRALDAMKAKSREARAEAAREKARADALQAKIDGQEAEHQAKLERERVQAEALGKANERILKAEVRAVAAGKLNDPADALRFIDLSTIEVDEDGEPDKDAITAAVTDLLSKKPYLAAQGAPRFQGGADGGARNDPPGKSIQERIAEAEKARDHRTAIRLRQELAATSAAAKK